MMTEKTKEILALRMRGKSYDFIARELKVSKSTIKKAIDGTNGTSTKTSTSTNGSFVPGTSAKKMIQKTIPEFVNWSRELMEARLQILLKLQYARSRVKGKIKKELDKILEIALYLNEVR